MTRPPVTARLAILLLALAATPAGASTPTRIAEDTWLLRGEFVPGQQPDGNSVILRGPDGLVVIDSGRHAAHADALVAFARELDAPIVVLVNTHWHLDHVGGNPRLRAAHPELVVHASGAIDGALQGFLARSRTQLQAMLERETDAARRQAMQDEIARIDAGAQLRPDEVVAAAGERELGGRHLQVGLETHAVTAADVWVYDPATRVLVAGDLLTLPAPFLDTACPARWQATLARLDAIPFGQLVPGHGPVLERKDFDRYRDAFDRLLACAGSEAEPAQCVAIWREAAGGLLDAYPSDQVQGLVEYYVAQRLRGAGRTADCP
jgi:glyoxylase-like metal-dependent hydrolase (beta-lactamase superfamily II)